MTAAVRFGRCELDEPATQVDLSGDVLSCFGEITAGSYDELAAKIAQLRGMIDNPDVAVFPVEFVDLPDLSGLYRGFSVSVAASQAAMSVFRAGYSLSATRVADFAQPTIEIQTLMTTRTNVHGITTAAHFLWRRSDLRGLSGPGTSVVVTNMRTLESGRTLGQLNQGAVAAARNVGYQSDHATHYDGGTLIEQLVGADWMPVEGLDLPEVAASSVRVSNGLTRVTLTSAGVLELETYDSVAAAWEKSSFKFRSGASAGGFVMHDISSAEAPSIVRNDIDSVSVRYECRPTDAGATGNVGAATLTVTLNAGDLFAVVSVLNKHSTTTAASTSSRTRFALGPTVSAAATSMTGAIRRTSNYGNGNRWVIACPDAFTFDAVTGILTRTDNLGFGRSAVFAVGQAIGGSAAPSLSAETDIVSEFYQTVTATSRVVAR